MNKIALAIIGTIAAAGLIFGGTAAASALADSTEQESRTELKVPELIEGRYYFNGDHEADLFLEVKDGKISTHGDKDEIFRKHYELCVNLGADHGVKPSDVASCSDESYADERYDGKSYGEIWINASIEFADDEIAEKEFLPVCSGSNYSILTHFEGYDRDYYEKTGMAGGSGYGYNGTDTIRSLIGDFILTE